MTSRNTRVRALSILSATIALFAALLAASPAQASHDDDHLVKVSSWCGFYVKFTNYTDEEVEVDWEIVAPLSPFSARDGDFSLDPHESYTLKAYGGQKGGPHHRLYYKAESDDDDEQEGYVDQWKYCKRPLVKVTAQCGYATFTNVFNHRVKVRYQEGPDYGYWEDDFRLRVGNSKRVYFDEKVLWWSAESRWGDDKYRRQVGTVYQPKKCEEYKKHDDDDDDDDDEWELHDAGDFILKIIPFTDGPLLDTSTFSGLFRR